MRDRFITVDSYFDGTALHTEGPYTFQISRGRVAALWRGVAPRQVCQSMVCRAGFAMPGLVEAHAHLFLDGGELDVAKRNEHLKSDIGTFKSVARDNLRRSLESGVTVIRDAGDIHGVNVAIREETRHAAAAVPFIRAAGRAIRKMKKYGSFMAVEVQDAASIVDAVDRLAPVADDLKVLLTGIIDFEKGAMKGGVQFEEAEACLITAEAKRRGRTTFVHCSGLEGLRIAVQAGFDTIEHGFFMTEEILDGMAAKGLAWVPTFCPVYRQYERPELAGWNAETVRRLEEILDNHSRHIALAWKKGVRIVAGSDAGSYGVPHGLSLVEELVHMRRAGMPLEAVLASATSVPRALWGYEGGVIRRDARADMAVFDKSPVEGLENLFQCREVVLGEHVWSRAEACATMEAAA